MFVDVCYTESSFEEYMKISESLNIKRIIFLSKKKIVNVSTYQKFELEISKTPKKNHLYFFRPDKKSKKKVQFPNIEIGQTHLKLYAKKNALIGFCFRDLLFMEDPSTIEKIAFTMKLCRKYNIKTFLCSFAKHPYDIRNENEIKNAFYLIFKDTKFISKSMRTLHDFLKTH